MEKGETRGVWSEVREIQGEKICISLKGNNAESQGRGRTQKERKLRTDSTVEEQN